MTGPHVRAELVGIVLGLVAGVAFALVGAYLAPAIDGRAMLSQILLMVGGALVGVAVALYLVAMSADDDLRQEYRSAARALVDKETFGGFRRH